MPDWIIAILAFLNVILSLFIGILVVVGIPALAIYCIYRLIKYIHQKTS